MKVWVLKHGEQLPLNAKSRIYRMGMISNKCIENNNELVWWTSKFNHAMKKSENINEIENESTRFIFLEGISYEKNISIKRIVNHYQLGKHLEVEMNQMNEKPDIILSAMPTIDFAYRAVKYGKENKIPVIIDIRDLWPDVFKELIPITFFKKDIFFFSFNRKLKWLLKNATAVTAITEEYLNWALNKANLNLDTQKHKVFPIGYPGIEKTKNSNPLDGNFFNVIFIGTIGIHFDLDTVLEVAKKMTTENIRFYIIGDGDKKRDLEIKYPLPNVIYTGWLDGKSLHRYLENGNIGIAPYKNTKNFLMNIPNKFYEYMAYGLPTITCLPGPSSKLVNDNQIGLTYQEGNVDELYNCILKMKKDVKLYKKIATKAEKTFQEKFSTSIIYDEYYNFIEKIKHDY